MCSKDLCNSIGFCYFHDFFFQFVVDINRTFIIYFFGEQFTQMYFRDS